MKEPSKKISDKVLGKIKKEELKPIPKWHFVLKNGFLWLLLIILLAAGAIAWGISLFQFSDIEWDLRPILGLNIAAFILNVFPYFWIIILGLVGLLAYFNFMATPKGYKYPKYQIILFGILIIILTGAAFRYLGWARNLHDRILQGAPQFRRLLENKDLIYNLPDKGLLAGEIVEYDNTTAVVQTFDGRQWQVDVSELDLPEDKQIEAGEEIKILGEKTGEDAFKAKEARPWHVGDPLRLKDFKPGIGKNIGGRPEGAGPPLPPPKQLENESDNAEY